MTKMLKMRYFGLKEKDSMLRITTGTKLKKIKKILLKTKGSLCIWWLDNIKY